MNAQCSSIPSMVIIFAFIYLGLVICIYYLFDYMEHVLLWHSGGADCKNLGIK